MDKRWTRIALILLSLGLLVFVIEFLRELPSVPPNEVMASPHSFGEAASRLYDFVWTHYWSTFALKYLFTIYSLCFLLVSFALTIQHVDMIPQILVYSATAVGFLIIIISIIRSGAKASVLSDVLFAYGTTLVNLGAGYTIAGTLGPSTNRKKAALQDEAHRAEISGLTQRLIEAKEQLARCQGRLEEVQNQRYKAHGTP